MSVNVRLRASWRRKATFLWFDSIRVRWSRGAQSLMGTPGKPAPEPMSMREAGWALWLRSGQAREVPVPTRSGKRWRAANRDSPKWRVTIASGWRTEVRLMRAFQRSNRSMYIDIVVSCAAESAPGLSRNGCSSSAMREVSMDREIVEGGRRICEDLLQSKTYFSQGPLPSSSVYTPSERGSILD